MIRRLLIANRGEIAIRVARAAAELGAETVAVHSADDAPSLHARMTDHVVGLDKAGPAAYLDADALVDVALATKCDAVHPGYGFLAESTAFARRCVQAGLTFVGPSPQVLELLGDKLAARDLAVSTGVPVVAGAPAATAADAAAFFDSLRGAPMMIKAAGGGGGRGMRVVASRDDIDDLFARCASEAAAAFGDETLYVERLVERARHIEVQIVGDRHGTVAHVWERDCSLQRRRQKVVEIAPAPGLDGSLREQIVQAAVRLAVAAGYDNAGTFEFLVDATGRGDQRFVFMEANARLQVEHTVTELVTGVDLVHAQLLVASGAALADIGLATPPPCSGHAVQVRVNTETMRPDGEPAPAGGVLEAFEPPSGPGIRVDTFGYAGYPTNPRFDSLLAKVVAFAPDALGSAIARAERALAEFRVEGVATNIDFLRAVLEHDLVRRGEADTRFIDEHAAELVESAARERRVLHPPAQARTQAGHAGVKVDAGDPLAVLTYGQQEAAARRGRGEQAPGAQDAPDGSVAIRAPLQGTIVSLDVAAGEVVRTGQVVCVMEAMKMEHEIKAERGGLVRRVEVAAGDTVYEGHPLLYLDAAEVDAEDVVAQETVDLDEIRPDLLQVLERRATTRDESRPKAVERRRATGHRTVQENVEDLFDEGTIVEYGPLVLAAQRARRSVADLIERSPRDGMITAIGSINGHLFDEPANRCAVIAYDYTVFAGTQGARNHAKTDRLLQVAEELRLPVVLFAEGGGGRPGDTEGGGGLTTFTDFPRMSGLVPLVGITSGRCFAGNASLLACCDVIIATRDSNIGMGGPAMIEGGGLGVFAPEDIGPMDVQVGNGVVDIAVSDEAEAVAVAKTYLSYFQGRLATWEEHDQRAMRRIVPENRVRIYEVRDVIETLADVGCVLELRRGWGHGMVTSLIRVEGRPVGVVANNPRHLGGAIDSDASDKGARFMQLCDAFDIPILFLCDTPGIMVGPEAEKTALVRHANRMFLVGANLQVPHCTVVLRKAYGLGAIAMSGGSYKQPLFSVSWPTGEFGGMGLEGMVKLGYRDELAAIEDPKARQDRYEQMVAAAYERGKALNNATTFHVDDAIDPAETRTWLSAVLRSVKPAPPRTGKKRPFVDAW